MGSRILFAAAAAGSSLAAAQSTPAELSSKTNQTIVVTGQRPAAQSSIDRKTYSVTHDLQSGSGSVADVLRNLPSVDVDAQGNVSLRGDQNVQILIDGKPSTSMNGFNRAETIQQLPASSIDRIEVMTNPSAQYKPDGSSGLINIITKRNRKPGQSGTAQASVGTDGRFNLGTTAAYNNGPLSLNAGLTLRRDVARRPLSDRRTRIDPVNGEEIASTQDSLFLSNRLSKVATAGIDYDLSPADRLGGAISYNVRTGHPRINEQDHVANALGTTVTDFRRTGIGSERETNSEGSITYRHSFAQKGKEFSLEVRRGESAETQHRVYTSLYQSPAGQISIADQNPHADEIEREVSADYTTPTPGGGKLQLGYDLDRNDDVYDQRGSSVDPATRTLSLDPSQTSRFVYDRTIHAFYGTLEHPLGKKLSAIVGLTLEDTLLVRNADSAASFREAIALFDAAIASDPNYGDAHLGKAYVLGDYASEYAKSPAENAEMLNRAERSAKRAAALMPGSGKPAAMFAEISGRRLNFDLALRGFEQALTADPNDSFVLLRA